MGEGELIAKPKPTYESDCVPETAEGKLQSQAFRIPSLLFKLFTFIFFLLS